MRCSFTYFLGDILEGSFGAVDFVEDGHERRRVRVQTGVQVTGWNSEERCACTGIFACGFDERKPHGIANLFYDLEVTWEKFPQ